mgnify:CR=1 FL=1
MKDVNELELELKRKQKEINDLKAKLNNRSPGFNKNLLNRIDKRFDDLCSAIGQAIKNTTGNESHLFSGRKLTFYYDSDSYSGSKWTVGFDEKDTQMIKDGLADVEMRKFQESLDNFAWALQQKEN